MNENVTHVSLGLHPTTMAFCFSNKPFHDRFIRPEYPLKPLKNPDIPLLESYGKDPGAEFWNQFPSAPIPQHISTPIDVSALKALFKQVHNIYFFPYKKKSIKSLFYHFKQILLLGILNTFSPTFTNRQVHAPRFTPHS